MPTQDDLNFFSSLFWASVIAKTWEDDNFKKQLLKDPMGELENLGLKELRDQNGDLITINIVDATSNQTSSYDDATKTLTLHLPQKPDHLQKLEFKGQFTSGCVT